MSRDFWAGAGVAKKSIKIFQMHLEMIVHNLEKEVEELGKQSGSSGNLMVVESQLQTAQEILEVFEDDMDMTGGDK